VATEPAESSGSARWPALIAIIGMGGSSLALPNSLVLGPRWLPMAIVLALLVPTLIAHRLGRHDIDRVLGYAISVIVTLSLVFSLALLIRAIPSRTESPGVLLRSAAVLWVTNILVFALWYWRLDAGGPHERDARPRHTAGAFFFPQMMEGAPARDAATWSPRFVDYLFVAFCTSTAFSPTDTPVLSRWAKVLTMLQALVSLLCVALLVARGIGML
jgi:uncharacterized membrane protein